MPAGGRLTIAAYAERREDLRVDGVPPGAYVALEVRDTGVGFDPAAPEAVPARLPGFRWRLFFYDASQSWKDPTQKSDAKRSYAEYTRWLCETWHAPGGAGARLARVRVDHAMEHTLPLGPARPVYETIYERSCPPRPRG